MSPTKFSRRAALALPLVAGLALAGCAADPALLVPDDLPAPDPVPDQEPAPEPGHTPAAPAAGLLLATLARSDEIALVDPAQTIENEAAAVVATVTVGAAPWGVGVHEATAYVATAEGLAVVDLELRERVALVPYAHPTNERSTGEYRPGGLGLAVTPDGGRVYVAVTAGDGAYFLEVFDTAAAKFVGSVPVGARPLDVLVAPDASWAATVDHDSFTVHVVDARSLKATKYDVAPFGTEGGLASWEKPHYGAVDAGGGILLPYQGQVVVRLDPTSGAMTEVSSSANSHAHGTALAGRKLFTVGTGSFGSATGKPNLSVLNLDSGEEQIVSLDVPHETVTVWKDEAEREFAAVAGGNTRDAGWDGLTLVALDDLSVHQIPVPGYPQVVVGFNPR